jgi:hypothetical protein
MRIDLLRCVDGSIHLVRKLRFSIVNFLDTLYFLSLLCLFFSGARERGLVWTWPQVTRGVTVNSCVSLSAFLYIPFFQIQRIFWSNDEISWSEFLLVGRGMLIDRLV